MDICDSIGGLRGILRDETAQGALVEGVSDGEVTFRGVDDEGGYYGELRGGVRVGCAEAEESLG